MRTTKRVYTHIIYTVDLNNSQVNYLNRTELFGYQDTELKAEITLIEAAHPDDKERLRSHWHTFLEAADPNRTGLIEYRIQDKWGQWRWLQSRQTIYMSDDDGKPTQILVTWTEITERKQAEESLRQERDLLRTLIDSLPDYILVKDREGHVVISNASHAQTPGLMPDELITKAAFDALPIDVSTRLRTEDQEIMQSGRAIINLEREVVGKDKKRETILITKIPLRDTTGYITGLIAVGRDITERKQLEAQSIELANERGRIAILQRFIHDMSHDFRTPLSIIRNSLYLLQRSTDAEKQQIYTQRAEQQIVRLDKLLDELLQMKSLDANEVLFDLKLTNINPLLAQLVRDYRQIALLKHITLDFVPADEVCFAEIDSQEFIRAMTKLLDNAITYTPEQGTVTIP